MSFNSISGVASRETAGRYGARRGVVRPSARVNHARRHLSEGHAPDETALFEKRAQIGVGMPYSPETFSTSMRAHTNSIEIPPVISTYIDGLDDRQFSGAAI
ncbi:FAD-dependent oxidoreductase [Ketogulonicigenium vulgare]|uniref:FAD-dependent oxidoreductase n=1 Tax=Ketogulonicigenium vulgare TaxID=92945 RepID=UPI001391E401|nr:FAD-dependent oxidoreductase [Ketogulonicigenium vulgare]